MYMYFVVFNIIVTHKRTDDGAILFYASFMSVSLHIVSRKAVKIKYKHIPKTFSQKFPA
jgi:hypothetical protein